ncbi:hypothetical protein psyc5s11_19030 [Clostridium gelidum]|uniref:Uncharacterized protein n=1 Tax=Clostridium gelidum TaxID=704125 RepID=A0ABN6IVZ7_9CLOT|nr:hypothetical protein psyc5s11_19030 [Clostridium gelidum]
MNFEYNELAKRINPPIFHRQVPKNIGAISELCSECYETAINNISYIRIIRK